MSIEELDKRIDNALSGWVTPNKKSKRAIGQSVYSAIESKQKRIFQFEKWHWIAAASLVAVIVCYATFYNSNVEYETNFNEELAITLPDGSTVDINSESNISYNTLSWYLNRSVSLSGEAFFQVKKGSQFSVKTKNGDVKVLGTSFGVFSRNTDFIVECFTGKVEINNSINKVIITEGERINQTDNLALTKTSFSNVALKPSWLGNNYSYAKVSLSTVFSDIEKHFNISITTSDEINVMSFTGEWNNTMKLEDVLKIVCLPFNID